MCAYITVDLIVQIADSYLLRVRALAHAHVCPHVRVRVFEGTFQRRARPGVWD